MLDGLRPWLRAREYHALAAMLFHQKEGVPQDVLDDLQETGTIHILATAGLHVGLFLLCCMAVLRRVLPRRVAVMMAGLVLAGYCVACGGWPACFRATLVAELCLIAWLIGRLPDAATTLGLAAAGMLFLSPRDVADPGFQLSFGTVTTILVLLPALLSEPRAFGRPAIRMGRLAVQRMREVAWLSVAAQLGSWPLTALYFGVVSWIGVVANMIMVPLLALVIPAALVTALLGHTTTWLVVGPARLLDCLLRLMLGSAHVMAALPLGWSGVDAPPALAVAAWYAILLGAVGAWRVRRARVEEESGKCREN
jgi:competence protein ComEC